MNPLRYLGFGGVVGVFFVMILAAVGIYVYFNRKELATAINPVDPNNLANKGVTAVVSDLTGRDETLGGWFYDLIHSSPNPQPGDLPSKYTDIYTQPPTPDNSFDIRVPL